MYIKGLNKINIVFKKNPLIDGNSSTTIHNRRRPRARCLLTRAILIDKRRVRSLSKLEYVLVSRLGKKNGNVEFLFMRGLFQDNDLINLIDQIECRSFKDNGSSIDNY